MVRREPRFIGAQLALVMAVYPCAQELRYPSIDSGHGTQKVCTTGEEEDGRDEGTSIRMFPRTRAEPL
jgi:hypothetical protein